jgi:hypothetical protein
VTDIASIVHGKQREAIEAMIKIFGDDSNAILNALHEIAVRVALMAGVSPGDFAGGVQHHWDSIVNAINEDHLDD